MDKILFEKEVCEYLNIPGIPLKEWNDKTKSFKDGVAIVELSQGELAYCVATYDANNDEEPRIKKTFSIEPFKSVQSIFIVPSYMDNDVEDFDMDEASKKAATMLAQEAQELENDGVVSEKVEEMKQLNEWVFPEITNKDEAEAWLRNYAKQNRIKGKLPKNEEAIKLRLMAIWSELQKKK